MGYSAWTNSKLINRISTNYADRTTAFNESGTALQYLTNAENKADLMQGLGLSATLASSAIASIKASITASCDTIISLMSSANYAPQPLAASVVSKISGYKSRSISTLDNWNATVAGAVNVDRKAEAMYIYNLQKPGEFNKVLAESLYRVDDGRFTLAECTQVKTICQTLQTKLPSSILSVCGGTLTTIIQHCIAKGA